MLKHMGGLGKHIAHAQIEEVRGMRAVALEPRVLDDFVNSLRISKYYLPELGRLISDKCGADYHEVCDSLELARSTAYMLYGNLGKAEVYTFKNLINWTKTWKRISEGLATQTNELKN